MVNILTTTREERGSEGEILKAGIVEQLAFLQGLWQLPGGFAGPRIPTATHRRDDMKNQQRYIPPVLVIGIDPGVKTGWCVYDVLHGEITEAATITLWEAYYKAETMNPDWVLFKVEDPAQNKPVWNRNLSKDANLKVAQDVGGNKKEARLLIEGLRGLGFCVDAVRPTEGKWTSRYFRGITGYEGRVSQHVRDAGRLSWGVQQWPLEHRLSQGELLFTESQRL